MKNKTSRKWHIKSSLRLYNSSYERNFFIYHLVMEKKTGVVHFVVTEMEIINNNTSWYGNRKYFGNEEAAKNWIRRLRKQKSNYRNLGSVDRRYKNFPFLQETTEETKEDVVQPPDNLSQRIMQIDLE